MTPAQYDGCLPAFPVEVGEGPADRGWHQNGPSTAQYHGMTLRDYASLQALPAVIRACAGDTRAATESRADYFARMSFEVADAWLAARSVTGGGTE